MKNQELFDFLQENGVCTICRLRYLKARGDEYQHVEESLAALNIKYNKDEGPKNADIEIAENANKKQRRDICPVCLGLFSPDFQNLLVKEISDSDIASYESDTIVLGISMPMLIQTRQLSIWYALLEKFGKNNIDMERSPDVAIKEATKLILNPIICEKLKKRYDNENGLMFNINLSHADEAREIELLTKLHYAAFPTNKGKKQNISRGILEKQYQPKFLSQELFSKYFPIPPIMPSTPLCLESLTITGPIVCVAGRYRKISRDLSHTPWVLNGKRVMEDSIEEIIMRNVLPYFGCDDGKAIFMSSGREDIDVRCLGRGRPFVLEIQHSKRITLPLDVARRMEEEIDKSLKVSVRDLQIVAREELVHIKTGEEKKRKYYRALCQCSEPVTVDDLEKLNLPNGFEIQQKTPIRVLHRRPLHTRPRMVYSLKPYIQRGNQKVLVLDIVSQAGTYIKELIHGEFGRTRPSIRSIIEKPIDIIALDVVAIDLDWPKVLSDT